MSLFDDLANEIGSFCYNAGMSTDKITMESVEAAMKEAQEIGRQMDRNLGDLAECRCSVCGRKPIVERRPSGPVTLVCRHFWDVLKKLRRPEVDANPFGLLGLRVELFDDGPARF